MYYKEYLRARGAVFVYSLVWAILFALTAIISIWWPMAGADDASSSAARAGTGLTPTEWPSLVGAAAFIASIVATVLGSTLAHDNDGHLEMALTKPVSRARYATTAIGVDLAAIVIAQLVGFAFIVLHYMTFHRNTSVIVSGADPYFSAVRYMLFPLAWYAVIVCASASLRGAGLIQGLIWPVAIVLGLLRHLDGSGPWHAWHNILVVLNVVNPLVYFGFENMSTAHATASAALPSVGAALVLALFVVVGWAGAIVQWRRVEA